MQLKSDCAALQNQHVNDVDAFRREQANFERERQEYTIALEATESQTSANALALEDENL